MEATSVTVLLRAGLLPDKARGIVMMAIQESETVPGISAVEVAAMQAVEPDLGKRRLVYAKLLAGLAPAPQITPATPGIPPATPPAIPPAIAQEKRRVQKRGYRSEEAINRKKAKLCNKQESQGTLLRPNFKRYVLAGDSNLREFASSIGYKPYKKDGVFSIGMCWGGATIREVLKELQSTRERKYIVMAGLNDVLRMNKVETILEDFSRLVAHLRTNSEQAVIISPPPLSGSMKRVVDTVINEMTCVVKSEKNITFLDLRSSFERDGTYRKTHLYKSDGIHLNANGLQVLESAILRAIQI